MSIELKFEILIFVTFFAIRLVWRLFGRPVPPSKSNNDKSHW